MEKLKKNLNNAGKIEKISIYNQMVNLQLKLKDKKVFNSYKGALKIFKDYLQFDSNPPQSVKYEILLIFTRIFDACRQLGSPQIFRSVYKQYCSFEKHFEDAELLAKLYSHLNYLFWLMDSQDIALEYGKKSILKLEECGNDKILPGRYSNVGYIYECLSDYDKAEEYYKKGLQFGLRVNSDQVICLAYCGYGRINLNAGNYTLAINYFQEALTLFPEHDSDYVSVINNLGIAMARMDRNEEAINYFSMFLTEETKKDNLDAFIDLLMNCANCYLALSNFDIAESQLLEALELAQMAELHSIILRIQVNLGNLEKKRENWLKAIDYYQDSFKSNKDNKDKFHEVMANLGLGFVYLQKNEISRSKEFLTNALKGANILKMVPEIIVANQYLAEICEREAKYFEALQYYKKLNEYQLLDTKEKFALNLRQLKLKYRKKEKQLSKHECNSTVHLISRELASKIKSPLIGVSQLMQKVVEHAMIAAENPDIPVLITGESDTGKEIIAQLIHYASLRKTSPFVVVNSAAFSDSLIDSAFFGSEKGAFTGADTSKKGFFEAADGGSLFLDEIGNMPMMMQAKFLRVIEQKVMHKVGSVKSTLLNFRLISATNKDLYADTETNVFRYDLLNRINNIEIFIPPLKERREDILILIDYFLEYFSQDINRTPPVISKSALEYLINYDYPGNVRELKNIIHRTLMFTKNDLLDTEDIIFSLPKKHIDDPQLETNFNLKQTEEMLIIKAMEKCNHVQLHAAKLLCISPFALNRKLKKMSENTQ